MGRYCWSNILTDRSIPGAVIGAVFSGPIELDGNAIQLKGATVTQFNWGQINKGAEPIPNSIGVSINLPAAFMPGQELILPVKFKSEVHVLQVGRVGN